MPPPVWYNKPVTRQCAVRIFYTVTFGGFPMKKRLFFLLLCLLLACAAALGGIAAVRQLRAARAPVTVAVIDTGISPHAIPAQNLLAGKNYLDPALSTQDTYGHGTAVASVILAHYPAAQLVPLVSSAYDGGRITQVSNDTLAQIIRDAVDVYGCRIINLSAGLMLDKPAVRDAVAYAETAGVLVVASAGNDYAVNGDSMYYPAGYATVLAVGSVNADGTAVSAFSQRGAWVDLYACGESVTIATLSGGSRTSDGTSYAAAAVTAAAAQLLQRDPALTPAALRAALLSTATPLPDGRPWLQPRLQQ